MRLTNRMFLTLSQKMEGFILVFSLLKELPSSLTPKSFIHWASVARPGCWGWAWIQSWIQHLTLPWKTLGLFGKKKQVDMYFHSIITALVGGGEGTPGAHRIALEGVPFLWESRGVLEDTQKSFRSKEVEVHWERGNRPREDWKAWRNMQTAGLVGWTQRAGERGSLEKTWEAGSQECGVWRGCKGRF